jgi:PPOX class probable F420-dependent enzyme
MQRRDSHVGESSSGDNERTARLPLSQPDRLSQERRSCRDHGLVRTGQRKVYEWTAKDSGKVKRIRINSTVQIAPTTCPGRPRGPAIQATVRILPVLEQHAAQQAIDSKYGWQTQFFALVWRLQNREPVYIEITPAEA